MAIVEIKNMFGKQTFISISLSGQERSVFSEKDEKEERINADRMNRKYVPIEPSDQDH